MRKLVLLSITALVGCSRTTLNHGQLASSGAAGGDGSLAMADASMKSDTAVGAADARSVAVLPVEPALTHADAAGDARSIVDSPVEPTATDEDCIIAIRTDVCCGEPFVISRHEMDEDPCIQKYYGSEPPSAECRARWPPGCQYADCAFFPPLTRIAGRGRDGTCQFLSECETDDDCVWALDARTCCGCPAYYPRSLLATDRCLAALESESSSDCPESTCATVRCAMPTCPPRTGACIAEPRQAAAGVRACTGTWLTAGARGGSQGWFQRPIVVNLDAPPGVVPETYCCESGRTPRGGSRDLLL
jgi:hypothetical protein